MSIRLSVLNIWSAPVAPLLSSKMVGHNLTPIIVGVGDFRNPSKAPEDALEPLTLIIEALKAAAKDTGITSDPERLLSQVDSFDVVRTWTWPYDNLAELLATTLEARASHTYTTTRHGGDAPCSLLDDAARRISKGESKIALVAGGEALASLNAYTAAKGELPEHWSKTKEGLESIWKQEMEKRKVSVASEHGIGAPIQVYPLYENAFRAQRRQSIEENNRESARMYGEFARIAASNPYAWNYGSTAYSDAAIGTVSKQNRMICFPYPLLMNAFNTVNLAAACILTSTQHARELGIPESQWIYPLGGAGTRDSDDFLYRPTFTSSPCITASLDAALQVSHLAYTAVDAFDFYSCFPIVPKLACAALRLPLDPPYAKPISLLGGLTSFGGAGNNYSMHALTAMVRYLRAHRSEQRSVHGLVLANGGVATYEYAVCLSTAPRADGSQYPVSNPLPYELPSLAKTEMDFQPNDEAVVETYTVDFGRDGKPATGYVVGRTIQGQRRFIAVHGDERTLLDLASVTKEPIGRKGWVKSAEHGNQFVFNSTPSV